MKRDPRLRSLSNDHHRALVMARKMNNVGNITPDILKEIKIFCSDELKPHFFQEESTLLPALKKYGENEIVERTLREHAQMVELAARLEQDGVLQQFAQLLKQHVRFEEQELFEVSQEKLSDAELDAVAQSGRACS